jgi:hypothetical protein
MKERTGFWVNGRGSGWFGRGSNQPTAPFGYHSQYYGMLVDKRPPEPEQRQQPRKSQWQQWVRAFLRRGNHD